MDTPEAVHPSENAPGGIAMPLERDWERPWSDVPHWYKVRGFGKGCAHCGRHLSDPIHRRDCAECEKDLKPAQHKWCSRACGAANHDRLHPRINPPGLGLRSQGSIKERIRKHLLGLEGRHATTLEIAAAIQERESTTARELRKLRQRGCPVQEQALHGPKKPSVFWIQKGAA